MKKDSFKKKLAAYIVMSEAFLLAHPVDAQVMYTDVVPDLLIENSYFNLDLNNDGVTDFVLQNIIEISSINGSSSREYLVYDKAICMNQNKIVAYLSSWGSAGDYPVPLLNGETINSLNAFTFNPILCGEHSGTNTSSTYDFILGYCQGQNKLIGLKVIDNGNTYYGWMRLDILPSNMKLKDYAINLVPDSAILAGVGSSLCNIIPPTINPDEFLNLCNDSITIAFSNPNDLNIQWMQNGQWIIGATDTIFTISKFGNYEILSSDNNCSNILRLPPGASVPVTVPVITQSGNMLQSSYSTKNQWYYYSVSNPLIGDTLNYYFPTSVGTFFVEEIFNDSCSVFSAPFVFWYDEVKYISSSVISYSIFNKKLLFHLTDNSLLGNQIDILNELGQLVTTVTVTNQTPEADLSALPAGIYFYHIRSKQKTYSGKFFIMDNG